MPAATADFGSMRRSAAHPRLTRPLAAVGVVAATLAVWLFAHLARVELTVPGQATPSSTSVQRPWQSRA